jgi:AcrR family transcriptional regulator
LSAEQRREQLIDAAVAVVASHGYQAATADVIARRAGVSKGLLWHYFADRDDLLEQAALHTLVALRTAVGAAVDLSAPVPQLIRAAVHRAADLRRTHAVEMRAIRQIVANLRDSQGQPRLGIEDYDETYAQQEALFRRGQHEGDIRETLDPRLLAVIYQGAVDTMLVYLDAHPDVDAEHHADTVADILLGGICRDRGSGSRRPATRGY